MVCGACASQQSSENPTAQSGANTQSSERKLQKVTIAQFGHVFLYMPLYVAIDKGYFKDQGLDVNLSVSGGDEKTFTAVATGNAQFGVSDPLFTAIAREHGQSGKVVAAVVRGVPFWVITDKKEMKPISKPEQFAGHKIATYTSPSTSYAVMKKVLANNGHPVDAKIVEGAFGTLPALLRAGQVDMALEIEPVVSIVLHNGGHIVYNPQKELGDFAFTGLEVSETFNKEHPDQVQGAVNALQKGMDFIHSDFAGAVAVAKKEFPDVEPSVVRQALQRLKDSNTVPKSVELPKAAWDKAVALRREIGDMKGNGDYDLNVDMSYADKATKK